MSRWVSFAMRGCASIAVLALAVASEASGAVAAPGAMMLGGGSAQYVKTQDVLTVSDAGGTVAAGEPGRLYVADHFAVGKAGTVVDHEASGRAVTVRDDNAGDSGDIPADSTVDRRQRIGSGQTALPWSVHVVYSLDGPETTGQAIAGASGLVGVRITVSPNGIADTAYPRHSIPVIAFTVPTSVAGDIAGESGAVITASGSDTLVAAVGQPGRSSTFSFYMNATKFTMGPIAVASVQAGDAAGFSSDMTALAGEARSLVNTIVTTDSAADRDLIDKLTTMRNQEQAAAEREIADKSAARQRAFDAYMAAYVGSYTTHLSGSIGSKTQMQALIGTAGELSGDTPLAQAVVDLANAVNAVSAAHQHTGAVDAIDDLIRRIRQRGTEGLINEIGTRIGEESVAGSKGYAAGQTQLSNAMIPYSMAYTDAYTAKLSALTGGTSAGASGYQQQAIAETNRDFDTNPAHADDTRKVDAAMSALAAASEHTGRANALRQISVQFADELGSGDGGGGNGGGNGGGAESGGSGSSGGTAAKTTDPLNGLRGGLSGTIAGQAETKRLAAVAKARKAEAEKKAEALASGKSTDDSSSMDMSDIMGKSGGLGALGGAGNGSGGSTGSSGGGESSDGGAAGGDRGASGGGGASKDGSAGANDAGANGSSDDVPAVSPSFGMIGMDPQPLLAADMSALIDETVEIGGTADLLTEALSSLTPDGVPVESLAKALDAVAKAADNADEPSYDVVSALNRNTRHVRLLMVVPEI